MRCGANGVAVFSNSTVLRTKPMPGKLAGAGMAGSLGVIEPKACHWLGEKPSSTSSSALENGSPCATLLLTSALLKLYLLSQNCSVKSGKGSSCAWPEAPVMVDVPGNTVSIRYRKKPNGSDSSLVRLA